jgi:tripeptidyl-peptidase-1
MLESMLLGVSDPDSPTYGQHLSHEAVNALVAPSKESVVAVRQWMKQHSADIYNISSSPNFDFFSLAAPVAVAESMLQTQVHHVYLFCPLLPQIK